MSRFLTLFVLVLGMLGWAPAQEREFTSADGQRTFRGEVLAISSDQLQVRRDDGRVFSISPEILSERDQLWLRGILALDDNPFLAPRQTEGEAMASTAAAPAGSRHPLEDLSPTARALLTGHATPDGPATPIRRARAVRSQTMVGYETPAMWGRWYAPVRCGWAMPHLVRHGNHWDLRLGNQIVLGFPGPGHRAHRHCR